TTTGTITQATLLTASSSPSPILCNGGNSSVTVSASGGVRQYTRIGTFSHAAGAFSYTVTDANACTATTTGTITQPTLLTASSSRSEERRVGDECSVTVSASGGVEPYTGTGTFSHAAGAYS